MIYDIDIAKQVAKSLMQIKAIILQPDNPFNACLRLINELLNFIFDKEMNQNLTMKQS